MRRITNWESLPDDTLLQVGEFTRTKDEASLLPHGRSAWLALVNGGKAPAPVRKSGEGEGQGTFWKLGDLRAYLKSLDQDQTTMQKLEADLLAEGVEFTAEMVWQRLLDNPNVEFVKFKRLNGQAINMEIKVKDRAKGIKVWMHKPLR